MCHDPADSQLSAQSGELIAEQLRAAMRENSVLTASLAVVHSQITLKILINETVHYEQIRGSQGLFHFEVTPGQHYFPIQKAQLNVYFFQFHYLKQGDPSICFCCFIYFQCIYPAQFCKSVHLFAVIVNYCKYNGASGFIRTTE